MTDLFPHNPLMAELGVLPTAKRKVNPLAVLPATGVAEVDAAAEVDHLRSTIKQRERQETARMAEMADTRFYAVMVFEHRRQRDAFLAWCGEAASPDDFVNGMVVAERCGVTFPDPPLRVRDRAVDRDYARLVEFEEERA